MQYYRKMLRIPGTKHVCNEEVLMGIEIKRALMLKIKKKVEILGTHNRA